MTFAVIGDSLPRERRATAFSVQSILVRVPRVIGAPIGGLLIASLGIIAGIRAALLVTLLLALGVLAVQRYGYREDHDAARPDDSAGLRAIFAGMPPTLKRLLVADCLVRIGEGIATSFIVLFVTQTRNFSVVEYGALYAMQQAVAIAFYLPGGRHWLDAIDDVRLGVRVVCAVGGHLNHEGPSRQVQDSGGRSAA